MAQRLLMSLFLQAAGRNPAFNPQQSLFPPETQPLFPPETQPLFPSETQPPLPTGVNHLGGFIIPNKNPGFNPQKIAPLSFEFRASRRPPTERNLPAAVLPRTNTRGRQFLSFGASTLASSCENIVRRPCNQTAITRDTCERQKCCWNPFDFVPCAVADFFILNQQLIPDFSECGVPSNGTFSNAVTAPPLLAFLLAGSIGGRIIGGVPAVDGEWPWIAYIYERASGLVNGGICGGSLISNRWVITAAHCIVTPNPSLYGVVLGAHTISQPSGREIFRFVSRIERHPMFDPVTFDFDVLLLELDSPIVPTQFVRPICLVPSGTRTDNVNSPTFAGATCTTLGWGFTSSPLGSRSDVLMRLDLTINPIVLCEIITISNSTQYQNRPVFTGDPKFCAGGNPGQDSCNGDSGGPLMCLQNDGRYYLHGLTSYGTDICAQGLPGIYTKLADPRINQFITSMVML